MMTVSHHIQNCKWNQGLRAEKWRGYGPAGVQLAEMMKKATKMYKDVDSECKAASTTPNVVK